MVNRVVVDAGPLIHLGQAGALFLLNEFEQVDIPQTVLDEITDQDTLTELSDLDHNVRRVGYAADDYPSLDPGETAAITLTREIGAILLTDDLAA